MKISLNGNLASDPKVVSEKLTVLTVAENNSKEKEAKPEFYEVNLSGEAKKLVDEAGLKKGDLVAVEAHGQVVKEKIADKYVNDLTIWGNKVELKHKVGTGKKAK